MLFERLFHCQKSKDSRQKNLLPAACCLLLIFFLSCQSAPKHFDSLLQETYLPLDAGASFYILANIEQARPIIELLPVKELQDNQTKQMLDRTDFAAVALFPYESGRYFQLAAWGRYPNSGASIALGANRYWEKQTAPDGRNYWYAEYSRMSIAVTSKQAFAASYLNRDQHNDPRALPPGIEIPEGFKDFSGGSPLSLWMNNPGTVFSDMMNRAGIPLRFPIQQLFINIYPIPENEYEASIRMIFVNATHARGAATMINLASGFAPAELEIASIFLANPPVLNGSIVDIKTGRLKENNLSALFGLLFN